MDSTSYQTLSDQQSLSEFGWKVSAVQQPLVGFRPTAHIYIDTRRLNRFLVRDLENILYGTPTTTARLPTLQELADYTADWRLITITDNGDGTWTATGPDELITMTTATEFQIIEVDATYSDADTYDVSTTQF